MPALFVPRGFRIALSIYQLYWQKQKNDAQISWREHRSFFMPLNAHVLPTYRLLLYFPSSSFSHSLSIWKNWSFFSLKKTDYRRAATAPVFFLTKILSTPKDERGLLPPPSTTTAIIITMTMKPSRSTNIIYERSIHENTSAAVPRSERNIALPPRSLAHLSIPR